MQTWRNLLKKSINTVEELPLALRPDHDEINEVTDRYPMRINPYYLGLIREKNDPLWKQAVPDIREIQDQVCMVDPLGEEGLSPVPNLIHKYPDRILFLVTSQCAMYCRFCTRKRKVGTSGMVISKETIRAGLDYIRQTPQVRDVLVSGGDPLLLDNETLEWILSSLRSIPSVEIIRIGSRAPCTLPMRVTSRLVKILKKYHPLYINTHFNHPAEITPESSLACTRLADAGIPLGCQTVLLRGVNDHPETMKKLMSRLLMIRVRPYYLFQTDLTLGTNHFRTPIETGLEIMKSLIGHTSGLGVPAYAVDAPGGGGKIQLTPNYVQELGDQLIFTNYCGQTFMYENVKK